MAITSNETIFKVDESEYGFTYEDFHVHSVDVGSKIKLVIPKIMGNLTKVGKDRVNINGLLDNDPSCKPTFGSTVELIDYMTATLKGPIDWTGKVDSNGIVRKGTRLNVEFTNGNIVDPIVTTK